MTSRHALLMLACVCTADLARAHPASWAPWRGTAGRAVHRRSSGGAAALCRLHGGGGADGGGGIFAVGIRDRMMYSHTFRFGDSAPFTTGCTAVVDAKFVGAALGPDDVLARAPFWW